jgi:hypothetical protein
MDAQRRFHATQERVDVAFAKSQEAWLLTGRLAGFALHEAKPRAIAAPCLNSAGSSKDAARCHSRRWRRW